MIRFSVLHPRYLVAVIEDCHFGIFGQASQWRSFALPRHLVHSLSCPLYRNRFPVWSIPHVRSGIRGSLLPPSLPGRLSKPKAILLATVSLKRKYPAAQLISISAKPKSMFLYRWPPDRSRCGSKTKEQLGNGWFTAAGFPEYQLLFLPFNGKIKMIQRFYAGVSYRLHILNNTISPLTLLFLPLPHWLPLAGCREFVYLFIAAALWIILARSLLP